MTSGVDPTQGSLIAHSARIVLTIALVVTLLLVGLLLLERSGPSPVAPFGQNISSSQPATPSDGGVQSGPRDGGNNPNRHCKHQPNPPQNCRPPSGT